MLKQLDVDWIALEYKKSGDASERDFLPSSKTAVAAKSHNGVVHWISHGMRFVSKGSSVTTASSLILYFTSDGSKARYVPLNSLAKLILSTQSQVAAVILHACNAGGGGDKSAVAKLKRQLATENAPQGLTVNGSTQYNVGMVLRAIIESAIKSGDKTPYETTETV